MFLCDRTFINLRQPDHHLMFFDALLRYRLHLWHQVSIQIIPCPPGLCDLEPFPELLLQIFSLLHHAVKNLWVSLMINQFLWFLSDCSCGWGVCRISWVERNTGEKLQTLWGFAGLDIMGVARGGDPWEGDLWSWHNFSDRLWFLVGRILKVVSWLQDRDQNVVCVLRRLISSRCIWFRGWKLF